MAQITFLAGLGDFEQTQALGAVSFQSLIQSLATKQGGAVARKAASHLSAQASAANRKAAALAAATKKAEADAKKNPHPEAVKKALSLADAFAAHKLEAQRKAQAAALLKKSADIHSAAARSPNPAAVIAKAGAVAAAAQATLKKPVAAPVHSSHPAAALPAGHNRFMVPPGQQVQNFARQAGIGTKVPAAMGADRGHTQAPVSNYPNHGAAHKAGYAGYGKANPNGYPTPKLGISRTILATLKAQGFGGIDGLGCGDDDLRGFGGPLDFFKNAAAAVVGGAKNVAANAASGAAANAAGAINSATQSAAAKVGVPIHDNAGKVIGQSGADGSAATDPVSQATAQATGLMDKAKKFALPVVGGLLALKFIL